MDDESVSTPDPLDSNNPSSSKAPAAKDRECQFCHQPFTSSSLGRHLDQYIKPDNPKKPDGIHDVETIRKERGGITRRKKGRLSSADRNGSVDTPGPTVATPASVIKLQDSPTVTASPLNLVPKGGLGMRLNSLTWHSTGVINEALDGPAQDQSKTMTLPSPSKRIAVKAEMVKRQEAVADKDTARALELALREVLDNVRAANVRAQPSPSPFEFDLPSQSFPALCLLCLPPPPSLFSVNPFSTSFSWPLDPPTTVQLDSVRQYLSSQIYQWRTSQNASLKRPNPKGASQKENIDRLAKEYEETVISHLSAAFKHWTSLPATQQHETYHLEILRAFARETEKRKSVDAQLVRVQQEADHLRAQVEKLSSCQNPREFTLLPPETIPIPRLASRELHSQTSKFEDWDYDRLINKWQGVVKSDRRNRNGMSAQRALPALETNTGPLGRNVSTPAGLMNGHHSNENSPGLRRDLNSQTHAVHFIGSCERGMLPTPQSGGDGNGRADALKMNVNVNVNGGTTSEDAEGDDDNDTGYGQVLMEMSGSGRNGRRGGGRYEPMEDVK